MPTYETMNGTRSWPRSGPSDIVLHHLAETSGRHTVQIEHLTTRVLKLEERKRGWGGIPWRDLAPILYGLIVLGLVMAGKLTWNEALMMARGGG